MVSMERIVAYGVVLRAGLEDTACRVVEEPAHLRRFARRGKDDAIDSHRIATAVLGVDLEGPTFPRQGEIRQALRVLMVSRGAMNTQSQPKPTN